MRPDRRVMVSFPPDVWDRITAIAKEEYREPRQQLQLIVNDALAAVFGNYGEEGTLTSPRQRPAD